MRWAAAISLFISSLDNEMHRSILQSNVIRSTSVAAFVATTVLIAGVALEDDRKPVSWSVRTSHQTTSCESLQSPPTHGTVPCISWARRTLAFFNIVSLSIPRIIAPNDPSLTLSSRHKRQRLHGDQQLMEIQSNIQQTLQNPGKNAQKDITALVKKSYEILYGPNLMPVDRQNFLQQYGCTGWTEEVIVTLLELGASRGFVEIGAGNGQWARVLNDRYQESEYVARQTKKAFEFCLAFDNMSALPLNPEVYHTRTKAFHDFFYHHVQPCDSISQTLNQWQCRGRILLLVYPSPDSDMAITAIEEYAEASPLNDTVVYVGEGRGGANANDAFFNYLENGDWILQNILPVRVFGIKGFEHLYVLRRKAHS